MIEISNEDSDEAGWIDMSDDDDDDNDECVTGGLKSKSIVRS